MKVLFVRYSALGDIVLTTGVIRYFSELFPQAEIHVLTSEVGVEVFSNLKFIHKVHVIKKRTNLLSRLNEQTQLGSFDHVFDWQGNLKSWLLRLNVKASHFHMIKKQSVERRLFVKKRLAREKLTLHVVQKYAQSVLEVFGLDLPVLEKLRPFIISGQVTAKANISNKKKIVINPFASQKNKQWPYFLDLVKVLLEKNFEVIAVGNGQIDLPQGVRNYINQTSLSQLIVLLDESDLIISVDSGPMHLAVGLGKKVISIFGPTTEEFGFFPKFKDVVIIENKNLACRPCHVHGGNECPLKHFKCMKDISVEKVLSEIEFVLKNHQ